MLVELVILYMSAIISGVIIMGHGGLIMLGTLGYGLKKKLWDD